MMSYRSYSFTLVAILFCVPAVAEQPAENMAFGKKYTLLPTPAYSRCTDPGDAVQLTDGQTTKEFFWVQPGTVGWANVRQAAITIDLGRVEPISGVSLTTAAAAAGKGGPMWPKSIHVFTSDDGKTYRDCGDLVTLDLKRQGPWPKVYAIRKLSTSDLRTRGRYVRFIAIPDGWSQISSTYFFCDEVEVFRGPPELLEGPPGGMPSPDDMDQWFGQWRVQCRYEADIDAIGKALDAATLPDPSLREALRTQWTQASAALRASAIPDAATLRAVLPYNDVHAGLFQVQAALWKTQGRADLTCGAPATWDPTDLVALPSTGGSIEVHTMRGEYRAAAVNLANASSAPIEARVRFEGLPDAPAYVTVHEVPWTDTSENQPVLAALPLAQRDGDAWRVTVLPGLVRQVWFTFHVEKLLPGDYAGKLVVESPKSTPLQTPVLLRVYPLDFPRQTTLQLGGWSYTNGKGCYGMTPQNRDDFLAHLKNHFVNAPWATSSVMVPCSFDDDGAAKINTREMNDWLSQWPEARMYFVNLSPDKTKDFGGAKIGTADFDRRVGAWISAWVRYLDTKGIAPEQLGLLLLDEPHEGNNDVGPIVAWAKAIHAAEPKVRIWEDPAYSDPAKAPAALFEACDILCPQRSYWLIFGKPFTQFYLDQQSKGHTLNLYSCSGPAQLLDPYSYYRLQAWQCRQINATGQFFWAFGDNAGTSSWSPYLAAKAGSYSPLFLDKTTVTAGKQMEAIREGVEDYEYFVLLRSAVKKAQAAGRSDAALARAQSLLAMATDKVLAAPGVSTIDWHTPKDRTKADTMRIQILESLSALAQEHP